MLNNVILMHLGYFWMTFPPKSTEYAVKWIIYSNLQTFNGGFIIIQQHKQTLFQDVHNNAYVDNQTEK